jgi:hypothetical protein
MVEVLGPIHERFQRRAGHAEEVAGFTSDGRQVTEFSAGELIEKQELLPWAKEAIEEATGIHWVVDETQKLPAGWRAEIMEKR